MATEDGRGVETMDGAEPAKTLGVAASPRNAVEKGEVTEATGPGVPVLLANGLTAARTPGVPLFSTAAGDEEALARMSKERPRLS